ncbi:Essential protein Yae1 [Hirschfeldia incana]|nr:Essential protein Yae1 [Hirschfeldia incana]
MEPPEDGKSNFAKELYGESLELSKPESSLGLGTLENGDGSFYGSSDEETSEAYSMNKDTENRREKFHTLGYRDGVSAGQEAAAQEGYNVGYKESVLAGYKFGIVRGVSSALAILPDELREKLIDEHETGDKFKKLHSSVHDLSTESALKLFYGALTTKQGEEGSGSSLGSGSGSVSATNDLGSYITELSSLLEKSPKIKVRLDE